MKQLPGEGFKILLLNIGNQGVEMEPCQTCAPRPHPLAAGVLLKLERAVSLLGSLQFSYFSCFITKMVYFHALANSVISTL